MPGTAKAVFHFYRRAEGVSVVTRDYYADGRALGEDLWEAGYKQWADKIDAVIAGGSTSNEILMGLRWTLSQLGAEEQSMPQSLRRRAESLRSEIDAALS
jgi:hypothetical protein